MESPLDIPDVYLTAEEAAALLRVHISTITAAARSGELPARKVGKEWRIHRDALRQWFVDGDAAGPMAERIAPAVARHVVAELATVLAEVGHRLGVDVKYGGGG